MRAPISSKFSSKEIKSIKNKNNNLKSLKKSILASILLKFKESSETNDNANKANAFMGKGVLSFLIVKIIS